MKKSTNLNNKLNGTCFWKPPFGTNMHLNLQTKKHPTMLKMCEGSVLFGVPHFSYANKFPPMQICDWFAVINILPACDFVSLELQCQQAALKKDFVNV